MTERAAPSGARDLIESIRQAGAARDEETMRELLRDLHPADVAEIMSGIGPEERGFAFGVLRKRAPAVISEVDREIQLELLELLDEEEVARLARELPSDEAVDLLGGMAEEKLLRVLGRVGEPEARRLRRLLRFAEDTAGGIMAAEVLAVREDASAADAIAVLRERAEEIEEHQRIYVVDGEGRLVGTLSLGRLLLAKPGIPLSTIMDRDVISVPTGMDQEEVAAIVRKYDLVAVPVVDASGRLTGSISVDDVVDVIHEEATEDVARMAGTTDEEIGEESVLRISSIRLPWLVGGLLGECVAALLLARFEHHLQTVIALVFFIPVITAMGGNVGMQSSTVIVRGLALGELSVSGLRRHLSRAVAVAALNGVVCGGILGVVAALWQKDARLGAVVGVSLFSGMIVAALTGTFFPLLLKRFDVDPAIASGPFVTVSNDVLNLLVYFSVASLAMAWLLRG